MVVLCFSVLISSVSAADYRVKNGTTHGDITKWIKNNAKTGNNLIFDVSSYDLTDTLVINKAINIKSSKNTQINFNKNKDMFRVTASGVTFSGLTLNFKGSGTSTKNVGAISTTNSTKKVNIASTKINVNGNYATGINIPKWKGSISKSIIKLNGFYCYGIDSLEWSGNLVNSNILAYGNNSINIYSLYWYGKIYGAKIYNYAAWTNSAPCGAVLVIAKGSISKSIIKSANGYAVMTSPEVKITGSTLSSKKGLEKVYRYLPDLKIQNVKKSGNSYYLTVYNNGLGPSKACYLGVKFGSSVKKVVVKGLYAGSYATVKVVLPSKYATNKYTKTAKIDYYNKVKESNEENNIKSFK